MQSPQEVPQEVFDSAAYPRTYAYSRRHRISTGLCLACVDLMIAIAAFFLATGPQTIGQRILLAVLCLVFALLSAYATLDLFRRRIVLNPDGIDSCCLFSVRKLARSEIAGRRILSSYLQITPLNKTAKKLYIPKGLTSDEHFDAWFADIPNLDFVEQSHSVDQLISDQRFGLTEEQRRETFIRAHSIAAWVNRAAFFATLWGLIYPRPLLLVVITWIVLPLLSLLLLTFSNGVYAVAGVPNEVRPSVVLPLFMSPVVMLFNLRGSNFLHQMGFLLPVALATLAMTFILVKAEPIPQRRFSAAAWSFIFCICLASRHFFSRM